MDGHFRSLIYMRPLAIWEMQWALSMPTAVIEAPKINIMDRSDLPALSSRSTHNEAGGRKASRKMKCFGNSVFSWAC